MNGQPTGPETLYAVVDTARDERLYPLVMAASDQACLFGGKVTCPGVWPGVWST